MSSFHKNIAIFMMLVLFSISNSFAQIAQEDEKTVVAIQADFEVLSKKIEDVFNKNPKIRDEMRNRIQEINKLTDETKLKLAADNYRSSYQAAYGDMVKAAGIDMNDFVKQMTAKYPNYTFTLQKSYGIGFKRKPSPGAAKSGTAPASPTTTTTPITGFLQAKETTCNLASGSSVTFPTKSVKAASTAVVAGLCSAKGEIKNESILPATASSIFLRLTAAQKVSGWAVGVLGFSLNHTEAVVKVWADNKIVLNDYEAESVIAPVFWVINYDEEFPFDQSIDLSTHKGKSLKVSLNVFSSAFSAACCATSSSAQVTYSKADLIVTN